MNTLDPRAAITKEVRLTLPAETVEALQSYNAALASAAANAVEGAEKMPAPVVIPEYVVILLREATGREKQRFLQEQAEMTAETEERWAVDIIMRRAAPGTDIRVVQALIMDMSPTPLSQLVYSYITGVLSDPKAVSGAIEAASNRVANGVFESIRNGTLPISPIGSESQNGNTTTTAQDI